MAPLCAALVALAASLAQADPPARALEWRRASAGAVYLATVAEVRQVGLSEGPGAGPRMEAVLKVDAVFRPPAPSPSPEAVIRYEQAAGELRAGVFYTLRVGDRVLVFAGSLGKEYPVEVVHGATRAVAEQVKALRELALGMDEMALRVHGITAPLRAEQVKLYDRILARLR